MSRPLWPEDREAKLRELHKQGLSIGQIAADFGVERGAVAGKLHRLGLLGKSVRRAPVRKEQKPKAVRRTPFRVSEVLPAPAIDTPPATGVSLFDLQSHHCRWPVGDAPYVFCGAMKVDGRYCASHVRLSRRGVANP